MTGLGGPLIALSALVRVVAGLLLALLGLASVALA